jgi:hypothetical protein
MDEATILAALKRLWADEGGDDDSNHDIYYDDAVLEFPQSQERFVGKQNFLVWRKQYPANVRYSIRRILHQGDLWVAGLSISYDGGPWNFGCSILEFRGSKIARETIYVGEGWEAPAWRAPWRADWVDEPVG